MDPLLKLLEEHALRTHADLAKMLNVSPQEVARRVKQYETDKVILGYKAVINDDIEHAALVADDVDVSIGTLFDDIVTVADAADLLSVQPQAASIHSTTQTDAALDDNDVELTDEPLDIDESTVTLGIDGQLLKKGKPAVRCQRCNRVFDAAHGIKVHEVSCAKSARRRNRSSPTKAQASHVA